MPKPLTVWITTNCGKFFKRWEYQITLPASWEIYMHVKKQQLELEREQWTGSKLGKEYVKYCHPVYLPSISSVQSLSCPTLWLMDCRMPGFPVHYQLPELAQTHVHEVGDAIQTFYPLSSPSLPAFNLSQHQGLFQWVISLHRVVTVLEL